MSEDALHEQPEEGIQEEHAERSQDDILGDVVADMLGEQEEQPQPEPVEEPEEEESIEPEEETPIAQTVEIDGQQVPVDELKSGYLRQADYTRKAQELAQMRDQTAPFAVLNQHLAQNPEALQSVIAMLKGEQKQEVPEDPVEAIKFEARQEAVGDARKMVEPLQQQLQQQAVANEVLQAKVALSQDPVYQPTHEKIVKYVREDYAAIHGEQQAQQLWNQLNQDPSTYMKVYKKFREVPGPQPKKEPKKAPLLQGGGEQIPPSKPNKAKKKQLDGLRKRAMGGPPEAVAEYLGASGLVDHLL